MGLRKQNIWTVATILFLTIWTAAALVTCLHRFWQYEVFYYDFGIFDSALFQLSRFQTPIIDHLALGRAPILADHFSPLLLFLIPFYWVFERQETLLIIQTLTVTASGWILYLIAKKKLGVTALSFTVVVIYLLFVGIQNAIITDFHEMTVAALPLMLVFWAITTERKRLFWIFLVLTLMAKENMSLTGVAIGIFLLFQKTWKIQGLITCVLSILWGIVTIKYLIPSFSQGVYMYNAGMPTNLVEVATRFFDNEQKRRTLLLSFGSFSFLPLLSPSFYPLFLADLAVRYLPLNVPGRWTLAAHYSVQLAVFMAVASVDGIKTLIRFIKNIRITLLTNYVPILIPILCIGVSVFLHQRVLHGPFGLAYNRAFYRHTNNFKFLDDFLKTIPKNDGSVMTQNNLAVRFTRQPVYMLDINYDMTMPEYIAIDHREGQNPNNYFGMHGNCLSCLVDKLMIDPNYELLFDQNSQKIWKKK